MSHYDALECNGTTWGQCNNVQIVCRSRPILPVLRRTQNHNNKGLLLDVLALGGAGERGLLALLDVTLRRSMIVYSLASLSLCCDSRAYANPWPRTAVTSAAAAATTTVGQCPIVSPSMTWWRC